MAMQVEQKTEKGTVLFIKVPEKFSNPFMTKGYTEAVLWPEWGNNVEIELKNDEHGQIDLNGVGWQLIGLTSEVTEEQAKVMVDHLWSGYMNYELKDKPVGNYNRYVKPTALDAFKSLMQHLHVYEVNPLVGAYNSEMPSHVKDELLKEYEQAQSITGKWIVLFKQE